MQHATERYKLNGTHREPDDVQAALKLIARTYYGAKGSWAYEAFEFINATYFSGALPWPKIDWALTAHGRCLGLTRPAIDAPPCITLHPSLLGGSKKRNPWGIDPSWLGTCYAFDVLLHECVHICVAYPLGGWDGKGSTSHNNTAWLGEVNRLAPLLGLDGIQAGRNKVKRVPDPEGGLTITGKQVTKVVRASDGNVPHIAVATFPYGVRWHLQQAAAYYRRQVSPFDEHRPQWSEWTA